MSELFNALQKLEEQNSQEVAKPPPVTVAENQKTKRTPPYLKSLLLLLLLITAAGFCLVFFWSQQAELFLSQIIQQSENSAAPPIVGKIVEPGAAVTPSVDKKEYERSTPTVSTTDKEKNTNPASLKPIQIKNLRVTRESAIFLSKQQPSPEPSAVEGLPTRQQVDKKKTFAQEIRKKQKDIEYKRFLYRAEKLRIQGETTRALTIYKKAWKIKQKPALANNIAAILLQSNSYQEAEHFLLQALKLNPEDPDLQYNLNIAQQGKK
jgi:tetratricopeptide (TPR) repeat protein